MILGVQDNRWPGASDMISLGKKPLDVTSGKLVGYQALLAWWMTQQHQFFTLQGHRNQSVTQNGVATPHIACCTVVLASARVPGVLSGDKVHLTMRSVQLCQAVVSGGDYDRGVTTGLWVGVACVLVWD